MNTEIDTEKLKKSIVKAVQVFIEVEAFMQIVKGRQSSAAQTLKNLFEYADIAADAAIKLYLDADA